MSRTSCARLVTPSFRKALPRWYSTVLRERKSAAPTSLFVAPSATARQILQLAVAEPAEVGRGRGRRPAARGAQLGLGAARPGHHPEPRERRRGRRERLAGIADPAAAAPVLPEEEPRARLLQRQPGLGLDGRDEQRIRPVLGGDARLGTQGDRAGPGAVAALGVRGELGGDDGRVVPAAGAEQGLHVIGVPGDDLGVLRSDLRGRRPHDLEVPDRFVEVAESQFQEPEGVVGVEQDGA